MTKNSDLFRAGFVVLGVEVAPHDRTHTKDLKEVLSHIAAGVALWIVLVADVDCRSIQVRRNHVERLLGVLQILVILRRGNVAEPEVIVLIARLRIDQPDSHQLFGMRKRQTAQRDRVYHGELRGGTANAQAEDEHGEKTKSFVLEQNTEADSHILTK